MISNTATLRTLMNKIGKIVVLSILAFMTALIVSGCAHTNQALENQKAAIARRQHALDQANQALSGAIKKRDDFHREFDVLSKEQQVAKMIEIEKYRQARIKQSGQFMDLLSAGWEYYTRPQLLEYQR
ncbi:MAG: hypothetical protein NTX45_22300 [Proteobacteria bacterium]|nr:hypothetical protein [Pseudomonadota bacterium]